MDKQEEEQMVFDMAKQDILFLQNLELVEHNDRPDFVLKDKDSHKIGLECFRVDVYQVQDENSSHISGGHTALNKLIHELLQNYHSVVVNNSWTNEIAKNAASELFNGPVKASLNMESNYRYEAFCDNFRVGIRGKPPKVKGHVEKSKNYPDRNSYDLMGFLIEIPVSTFEYHFDINIGEFIEYFYAINKFPLSTQEYKKQITGLNHLLKNNFMFKINGIPITSEIWDEIEYAFNEGIDFVIIETHDSSYPVKHYGQYFTKDALKPIIQPRFSFRFTGVRFDDFQTTVKDGNVVFRVTMWS